MVTGEKAQTHYIHILLDGRVHHLVNGLPDSGEYDLHSGILQCARDDLGATVVPVEAGLGNEYSNPSLFHLSVGSMGKRNLEPLNGYKTY